MKTGKKKILVTGSNGQLGKALRDIADNFSGFEFLFSTSNKLDISNAEQLESFFSEYKPDFCINCAGYTNVDLAEKEPEQAFKINAEGVKSLALVCNKYHVILVHISTDYVFDGTKRTPYLPEDKTNPINIYGRSKLAGEKYIQECLTHFYIIRTSWLFHRKHGKNFYKTILAKSQKGESLSVTGSQTGCPTNAANLARFIIELIIKGRPYGLLHFCDGKSMTWYEFAKEILRENNLLEKTSITERDYNTIAPRPVYSVLKSSN